MIISWQGRYTISLNSGAKDSILAASGYFKEVISLYSFPISLDTFFTTNFPLLLIAGC